MRLLAILLGVFTFSFVLADSLPIFVTAGHHRVGISTGKNFRLKIGAVHTNFPVPDPSFIPPHNGSALQTQPQSKTAHAVDLEIVSLEESASQRPLNHKKSTTCIGLLFAAVARASHETHKQTPAYLPWSKDTNPFQTLLMQNFGR
ncbi:hypothetical protein QBC46DRAFT_414336 [Diplogelasinospora grovesii]|uniref:Uncharacterized protein n=1 Tax=Diplogelasinospora grovesii TaxID=303347 RepID=A0AAN6MVA1_9PEZI|nr:hypothetical protein QBC46DRAFT_414336 [Diplogelasinospora grovesii]